MKRSSIQHLSELRELVLQSPKLLRGEEELAKNAHLTLDGLWGSSQSLVTAALGSKINTTSLIVLSNISEVERWKSELIQFGCNVPELFPPMDLIPEEDGLLTISSSSELTSQFQLIKQIYFGSQPIVLLTTIHALLQPTPSEAWMSQHTCKLNPGIILEPETWIQKLIQHGWKHCEFVQYPGEFSLRGGIIDIYPLDFFDPIRIEFFGDEIDSIREFNLDSQRSLRELKELTFCLSSTSQPVWMNPTSEKTKQHQLLLDWLPDDTRAFLIEPFEIRDEAQKYIQRLDFPRQLYQLDHVWDQLLKQPNFCISRFPGKSESGSGRISFVTESVERFSGLIDRVQDEFDQVAQDSDLFVVCQTPAEKKRIKSILKESQTAQENRLHFCLGEIEESFRWVDENLVIVSDDHLFHKHHIRRTLAPQRKVKSKAIDSFLELKQNDYVVHLSHGIGRFIGMKMLEKNEQLEEHLIILFADDLKVYVPASKIELIQKYVGAANQHLKLAKVGGSAWEKRKVAAQKAVNDLASELIDLQAKRESQPGFAYPADSSWQKEFEDSFPFQPTPDQSISMNEIREDMQATTPMDRLLCGDVGFGKTELAMRATFKAVDAGKQVAVLVPTTLLSEQHHRVFQERMAEYPFQIESVSRFTSTRQLRKILKQIEAGEVDILIGTHRLLSPDIQFRDLGLLIVDEEQRFGVKHKEYVKRIRAYVDILTLSATPIPRTLHSALLGIRQISNLQTPPPERQGVETRLISFDERAIRFAILRELNRNGQMFFVHNRIKDMQVIVRKLEEMVPEARIVCAHGRMKEDELEQQMLLFLDGHADILVATTIIESGLDISNANTIFINEGNRYGLADLHQLRGRVGRSGKKAYCYLITDEKQTVTWDAQRRLKAIEEFSDLGSGFQIALRDLEIRGAGNILGPQQSGHIAAIGYELYCRLLENAVRKAKSEPIKDYREITIELPWKAFIPHSYLPSDRIRIDAYRRLARIESIVELNSFSDELIDKLGKIPNETLNLFTLVHLRILAKFWQIDSIKIDEENPENLISLFRNRDKAEKLRNLFPEQIVITDGNRMYFHLSSVEKTADSIASKLKSLLQPNDLPVMETV